MSLDFYALLARLNLFFLHPFNIDSAPYDFINLLTKAQNFISKIALKITFSQMRKFRLERNAQKFRNFMSKATLKITLS